MVSIFLLKVAYLVVLGERVLFVGIVVNAAPVGEHGRVGGARRIAEGDPVPLAHAVAQLGLRMLVQLGLVGRYERRLVALAAVLAYQAPHFAVHALRTLKRLERSLLLVLHTTTKTKHWLLTIKTCTINSVVDVVHLFGVSGALLSFVQLEDVSHVAHPLLFCVLFVVLYVILLLLFDLLSILKCERQDHSSRKSKLFILRDINYARE